MVHCWLVPPWQAHNWTLAAFAVAALATSRHNPYCAFEIVPLALRFHRWFAPPWQSQMIAAVPFALLPPEASRHLRVPPEYTESSPPL